jgi:hypothetical protein
MTQQDMIPFRRIIDTVGEFCRQRRTGTVFIVSDDNRMAQVHLESGNIVALLCRGRHGQEAVAGMRTMQAGRLRFDDNYLTASDVERFDTHALLELLGGGARAEERPAPPAAPASAAHTDTRVISPAQAVALEHILMQYIGPMAEIICADHVAQAANLPALIAVLADELPDKAQAARFSRDAGRLLGLN